MRSRVVRTIFSMRCRPTVLSTACVGFCGILLVSNVVVHLDETDKNYPQDTDMRKAGVYTTYSSTSSVVQHGLLNGHKRWRFIEKSNAPERQSGISRYEFAQVKGGRGATQEHRTVFTPVPSGFWSFFALSSPLDDKLATAWFEDNLIPAVVSAVADLYSKLHGMVDFVSAVTRAPRNEEVQRSMIDAYGWLADDLSRRLGTGTSGVIHTNASPVAMTVLFYDSHTRQAHLSKTAGAFRAVLGRRIQGEGTVVSSGVVPVTQACSNDPPSLSNVNPRVTSIAIESGDFIVLGTRALWDKVTDVEAVQLIEEFQEQRETSVTQSSDIHTDVFSPRPLSGVLDGFFRPEIMSQSYVASANAAGHLVQIALHRDLSLETQEPGSQDSESSKDIEDITALIIFFNDNDGSE